MSEGNYFTKARATIVREGHLDFLYDLYLKDVYIGEESIALLKKHNYIQAPEKEKAPEVHVDNINRHATSGATDKTIQADASIDIVKASDSFKSDFEILLSHELEERRRKLGVVFEGRKTPILRHEWLPVSTTEHTQEFIDWINSINQRGFHNRIAYRPFTLYCQQAYGWLADNKTSSDFEDEDDREDYRQEELDRCDDNALYFLDKYVYYQEGSAEDKSGRMKYVAAPPHAVLAFLDDCNYSLAFVKGRQQAATTTIMSLKLRNVIFKRNNFMKFITEDDAKAVEIFEDKLKYPFGELPEWMRPVVSNDRDNYFKMGVKTEKGKRDGVGSRIRVVPPKRTAVAGGAPQEVCIDEAGNINILGEMIGNSRPTMFFFNPRTGKLEMRRKLWFWGTGGEMEKGGKALETEFMSIYTDWNEGKFDSGVVPLFFNWRCRPGATQDDYDREKRVAYKKAENPQDPKGKQHITEFHQSWPETLEDVFRTSAATLVDGEYIDKNVARIDEAIRKSGHTLFENGYFEPVYDESVVMPEGSMVPYKIVDAVFVPTGDIDRRASVIIFDHPKKGWVNRYFKGTDPIDTNTGLSKFASAIWDKEFKCPVSIMDWRISDYREVFLQSILMNIYYDTAPVKKGVKELLESNRGTAYYDFCRNVGWDDEFVLNYQLPLRMQNKTTINEGVGFDKKGQRSKMHVDKLSELIELYGQNIYFKKFWGQLKTFTHKISATGKTEEWGPINPKFFNDDILDAVTYSYICAELCFDELKPTDVEKLKSKTEIVYEMVRDSNQKMSLKAVRKRTVMK